MARAYVPRSRRYASGRRGKRITEDDPRWNPITMGNHRGSLPVRDKNRMKNPRGFYG